MNKLLCASEERGARTWIEDREAAWVSRPIPRRLRQNLEGPGQLPNQLDAAALGRRGPPRFVPFL